MGNPYMSLAIEEARKGIHAGHGGPFGSVIVKDGVVIGKGNLYVSRGVTSISLDYLDLPKGNFVVKFEIGNTKLQQTIAVTGK